MSIEQFRPLVVEKEQVIPDDEAAIEALLRSIKAQYNAIPEDVKSSFRDKTPLNSPDDLSPAEAKYYRLTEEEYSLEQALRLRRNRRVAEQAAERSEIYQREFPAALKARLEEYQEAPGNPDLSEEERAAVIAERDYVLELGLMLVENARRRGSSEDHLRDIVMARRPRRRGSEAPGEQ